MKKLIFLAFILFFHVNNENVYSYYFPLVMHLPNVGVAWYATPNNQTNANKLGGYYWYNSSSCQSEKPMAIGIVRHHYNWQNCDNNKILLVGNEGEGVNQDNLSPLEMAQFILDVKQHYPNSILVCLNSYKVDYINEALSYLPNKTCDYIGIHIYWNFDIDDKINRIEYDGDFWVTEIGWSNNNSNTYNDFYNLVYDVYRHPRVKMIFAYTSTDAHVNSVNMIDENTGLVLPNGRAFRDAVKAYP